MAPTGPSTINPMHRNEYRQRRERLLRTMPRNSIAIVPTSPAHPRNRDVEFPFRPESTFYYLTGFDEPEAVAVMIPDREEGEFSMFARERDAHAERWDGHRLGLKGIRRRHGVDQSFDIAEIDRLLPELIAGRSCIFYTIGNHPAFDRRMIEWISRLRVETRMQPPADIVPVDRLVDEMRLGKSDAEMETMREAARISVRAHERAMRLCRPGMHEFEIEAELLHEFMRAGCRSPAYPSIVAGGANACVLHYVRNDCVLEDGRLLLIDAGAEYRYYAADITRTFPINGKFSPTQRDLYCLVLAAQEAAIAAVAPENTLEDVHQAAVEVLVDGLTGMGLLKGRRNDILKNHRYARFYMHRTGHWLGMDVHDVGDYRLDGQWRALVPGMVATVEPGLYFAPEERNIPDELRGVGIRIEDDVLVNDSGCEVLTAAAAKSVDEIEAITGVGLDA